MNNIYWRISNSDNTLATTLIAMSMDEAFSKAREKLGDEMVSAQPMENESYDIEILDRYTTHRYEIGFPFGNFSVNFLVDGFHVQDCLNVLADLLVEREIYCNLWTSREQIEDEMGSDYENVEDYVDEHNMICVGNTGVYMNTPIVREVK